MKSMPPDVDWALRQPVVFGPESAHVRRILKRYTAKQIARWREALNKPAEAPPSPVLKAIWTPRDGYGWRGLKSGPRLLDREK